MAKPKKRKAKYSQKIKKHLNYDILFTCLIIIPLAIIASFYNNSDFNYDLLGALKNAFVPSTFESDTAIHFIDVGQADATLIEQDGEFCLIDTGTANEEALISYLQAENVNEIELLILTHHHADHIGGAVDVMQNFDIGEIWLFDYQKAGKPENVTVLRTLEYIDVSGIPDKTPKIGEVFNLGEGEIEVLHTGIEDFDNANNTSVITMFKIDGLNYLSCGDAEQTQLNNMLENGTDVSAQIYKAAHHGSQTSNSAEFLHLIKPEFVTISCALENSYGHPHEESLNAFEEVNSAVYGTNVNGDIVIYVENGEIKVDVEHDYY